MDDPREIRKTLLGLLEANPDEFYLQVSTDPCFFFDACVWTYDPRSDRGEIPMVLWPFQRRTVHWIQQCLLDEKDFLIDKSRDMGATWMMLGLCLYNWLFYRDFDVLAGSWKEEYVDKRGDKNTHFERLRFMIRRLPTRLFYKNLQFGEPGGFNWKQHSAFMRLVNPVNGSQIIGESTNENFGRSGRHTLVWIDELARIDSNLQKQIMMGLPDQANVVGITSTPRGRANLFAQLRFGSSNRVKTLRWCMHPRKAEGMYYLDKEDNCSKIAFTDLPENDLVTGFHDGYRLTSPWRDAEIIRRQDTPGSLAQEVDIDYLTSGAPVFSPKWSELHAAAIESPRYRLQPVISWGNDGKSKLRWEDWGDDGEFWIWNGKPHGKSMYCIGVDVSEGLQDQESDPDYHAVIVWDVEKCHIVATLRTRNLDPRDLAVVVADLTRRWGAFLTIERNGPGLAVLSVLSGLLTGYHLDTQVFRPRRFQERLQRLSRDSGFKTTRESKPHLIELIRHWTHPEHAHLRDERLINEYSIYARLPGFKMGAPAGSHDDMVMALGQALVAAQEALMAVPRETAEIEDGFEALIQLGKRHEQGQDVRREVRELVG